MYSVTGRIQQIKQPRGGYIQPRSFTVVNFNDGKSVSEDINVSAAIIGLAVDYMLRYLMSEKANIIKAFEVSCMGAIISEKLMNNEAKKEICGYLKNIKGLDDNSIINACKAVTFDVWFRNFSGAMKSRKACDTNPNAETIENIYEKFEMIQLFPGMGSELSKRVSLRTEYQYIVWNDYIIIYKVRKGFIEIYRVVNRYQDITRIFD